METPSRSMPLLPAAGAVSSTEVEVVGVIPSEEAPASHVASLADVPLGSLTERVSRSSMPEDVSQVPGFHDRARSVPPPERERMVARLLYQPRLWQASLVRDATSATSNGDLGAMMPDQEESDQEEQRRLSHHMSAPELPSTWQVAEELGQSGGMAAPRYLLVRLGECIPAETGAAPVHRSRLDSGPQWRDFLNFADRAGSDGVALEEVLTCPCCLSIFRQPIGLPCGHSLCRGCYVRVSSQPSGARRCPLCRADLPRCDLRVNVALAAVSDALRAFQAVKRPRATRWQIT